MTLDFFTSRDARTTTRWLGFLLASVTLLVYTPALHCGFVLYDDPDYVTRNPHVLTGLTWRNICWAFTTGHADNWHPLTWISHMADCQFFGANPRAHHLVNVLFHIANAVMLLVWLRESTGSVWRSAFVATLFALHPLHVQSVAWISERKDLVCTLFGLLSLICYTRFSRRYEKRLYLLALAFFVVGLLAKPMLVTLPFLFLLLDFWPLGRWRAISTRVLMFEKVPFLFVALASSFATILAQKKHAMISIETISLPLRIENGVIAYVAYLGKSFWPANLSVIYPYQLSLSVWQVSLATLLLAIVSFCAVRFRNRMPYLGVGWFWFLGTLVPVIGIVQVGAQPFADRYTYIPLIGVFIAVTWGAHDLFRARWIAAPAVLALGACALITRSELAAWTDSISLFQHAIAHTAGNSIAHINLGVAFAAEKRLDEAIAQYRAALQIQPQSPKARNNLGRALVANGNELESLAEFAAALRMNPGYAPAHSNMADALMRLGRANEAVPHYSEALRLDPENAETHDNFGRLLLEQGRPAEALAHFSDALRLNQSYVTAWFDAGNALMTLGEIEEATQRYATALALRPQYPEAHYSLGLAWMSRGRFPEAVREYSAAISQRPDYVEALSSLAWLRATNADPQIRSASEAVRLAGKANDISGGKEADVLDTLAAAYAESGRFEEAAMTAEQAMRLAEDKSQSQLAQFIKKRLALYKGKQPYHER